MLLVIWGLVFAATTPVRQAYLNGLIPSQQRATVLSFNSLLSSAGGVGIQPALGKAADVWGYGASLVVSSAVSVIAVPFLVLARRTKPDSDPTNS
jgi:MFS family permease